MATARNEHEPRHRWRAVAFDLSCAVAGLIVLLLSAAAVHGDAAPAWERSIFHFFNDLPGWLTPPVWLMMQMGNMVIVPIAVAGALIMRRWALAVGFLIAGAAKYFGARVIKDVETRHRPGAFIDDMILRAGTSAGGLAFVSGHATIAVAVAAISSHYLGLRGRFVAWTLAVMVCFGRIYVGAHLPLDVIGGAALGMLIGGLVSAALAWVDPDPPRLHRLRAKEARSSP
jgi:glycosyltransferase 2 family protein